MTAILEFTQTVALDVKWHQNNKIVINKDFNKNRLKFAFVDQSSS
jgi:hypothetical protein